jgi:hypothetical protein
MHDLMQAWYDLARSPFNAMTKGTPGSPALPAAAAGKSGVAKTG